MARTEYYDDPQAPVPNSLVVAASAVARQHVHRPPACHRFYGDGEVRRQFNVCFTARITGGDLTISDESTEVRFAETGELEALPMHHTQRLRLRHFLDRRSAPYLG